MDHFAYRHYRTWPDTERWEIIEGQAWAMSPAPMRRHQVLCLRLATRLSDFLEGKTCRAFIAPFDVLLPEGDEPDAEVGSIVQPDISVFCDLSKLTDRGARGAPDFIAEILSPSTSKKDHNEKFRLYESRGVREYWILDPAAWSLWAYRRMENRAFDSGELRDRLGDLSPIASSVLEGFIVDPERLFADLD